MFARDPVLSVVTPAYNEAMVLDLFADRLRKVADGLNVGYEVVIVDDGSTDDTPVVLERLRREWSELRIVRLRANAGHQAALSAGLQRALGEYVVTLDADLQDPPEVIAEMLNVAMRDRVDVVYGVRSSRDTDSWFKRSSAGAFYRLIGRISRTNAPAHAGDFRLMSRPTVEAVNALPERSRVLRMVVPALGFPSATVEYRREHRAAGESKYPLSKMLQLSLDGVAGYSIAPLRIASWVGLLGGLFAVGLLAFAIYAWAAGITVPGWTSSVVIVSAFGALQLTTIGILGEYVGRIYATMQSGPLFHVESDSANSVSSE